MTISNQTSEKHENQEGIWPISWPVLMVMILGSLFRLVGLDVVPMGLNQDEASIGYEAFCLFHFGVDRSGLSYPVQSINFGNGGHLLYAYLVAPFTIFGLTPFLIRLPMAILGSLSLLLVYFVTFKLFGRRAGFWSLLFVAFSPWHVMMSRWSFEGNTLPSVFLMVLSCFLAKKRTFLFVLGYGLAALCLYAYGPAYISVTAFIFLFSILMIRVRQVERIWIAIGVGVFLVMALPLFLYIVVNIFGWDTIQLGPITIPRLPQKAHFLSMASLGGEDVFLKLSSNIKLLFSLVLTQKDRYIYNTFNYGYLYILTTPLVLWGVFLVLKQSFRTKNKIFSIWLISALLPGCFIESNINRMNMLFIPLIIGAAIGVSALVERWAYAREVLFAGLVIGFSFFASDYFFLGRAKLKGFFYSGLIEACQDVARIPEMPVCVTDKVRMPHLFALFAERTNPFHFSSSVEYRNDGAYFTQVESFGRYAFDLRNCDIDKSLVIAEEEESIIPSVPYSRRRYGDFLVYEPN